MAPAIIQASNCYRKRLLAHDDRALRELQVSYQRALHRLQDNLDAVAHKIAVAQAKGEKVDARYLDYLASREDRYKELISQIDGEMSHYAGYATRTVESQQSTALSMGIEHASGLLDATIPSQLRIGYTFNRANPAAIEHLVGFLGDDSPLAYKFASMPAELKSLVRETFVSEVAKGTGPRQIAAAVNKAAMGQMSNVLTVCRTETLRAYRTASDETYAANNDVLDSWIWCSAHQENTCASCWAMDGTRHRLEEPLMDHVQGRCSKLPVTKPWSSIIPGYNGPETRMTGWDSETYFSKLPEESQLKVLGKGKFDLYQAGEIRLSDIPVLNTSEVWGDSYQVGSIQHATANASLRRKAT